MKKGVVKLFPGNTGGKWNFHRKNQQKIGCSCQLFQLTT
jgi:hypothetical protein